jgi:hypothetical protein
MERRIVNVGPAPHGWRIERAEREPITLRDIQQTIVMACDLARIDHRSSGRPTAVKVSMTCGYGRASPPIHLANQ